MPAKINLLLVDDDDVATESVMRSLARCEMNPEVVTAEHGLEALDILQGRHPDKHIHKPYLVLLDLNMPRMNGFEFLENLRADDKLRDAVVFVLTTSDADTDRTRAYHENIAGYMVKSCVGPQFRHLASLLDAYQQTVRLPE